MSKWYLRVKRYYDQGIYTAEEVEVFVPSYITQNEYNEIINKAA